MASVTLPFFTILWVAAVTAVGLAILVLIFKVLRSSETDVDQTVKSLK